MDFILTNRHDKIQYVTILNRVNGGSNHKKARGVIKLHQQKERNILIRMSPTSLITLLNRKPKFAISIQNRYEALNNEENLSTEKLIQTIPKSQNKLL